MFRSRGFQKRPGAVRRGVLSFEWMLIVTLLVVGLIGGLAGVRNAILDGLFDLESAIEAMNFSGHHGHGDADGTPATSGEVADDGNAWWNSSSYNR
jgi:hypothetical protein